MAVMKVVLLGEFSAAAEKTRGSFKSHVIYIKSCEYRYEFLPRTLDINI